MNSIKHYIAVGVLSVALGTTASCSVWDFVKPSSGLSVDTELVVGDKQQVVHTELGQTTNTADNIIQNIDNTDKFMTILALTGWLLPTPGQMWENSKAWYRRRKK